MPWKSLIEFNLSERSSKLSWSSSSAAVTVACVLICLALRCVYQKKNNTEDRGCNDIFVYSNINATSFACSSSFRFCLKFNLLCRVNVSKCVCVFFFLHKFCFVWPPAFGKWIWMSLALGLSITYGRHESYVHLLAWQ